MLETLIARRIGDNLAWARPPGERKALAEVRKLWSAGDEVFVRGLYPVLLRRDVEDGELCHWLRFLNDGGQRADLIRILTTSDEARRARIDTSWLPRLRSLSSEACWAELLRLWPQPDELFVKGVYELLLLRPAEQRDMTAAHDLLAYGSSRVDLIRLLTATEEFARLGLPTDWLEKLPWLSHDGLCGELLVSWREAEEVFVRRLFELVLHRQPGEKELGDNVALLHGGCARLDLVRSVACCEEARQRGYDETWFATLENRLSEEIWTGLVKIWGEPDLAFARDLHQLLLRRPVDAGALVGHVAALRNGRSRLDLVRALARGEEGHRALAGRSWLAWLDSAHGRRVLRRAAGARPPVRDAARRLLDRLPARLERGVFVRRAYQEIMGRQPTAAELRKQVFRLRYFPLYTRAVFLRRLIRFRNQLQGL
jgi:hypothetical protein